MRLIEKICYNCGKKFIGNFYDYNQNKCFDCREKINNNSFNPITTIFGSKKEGDT